VPTLRADDAPERFRIAACRERWLDFAALEHETLLPVEDFALSEDSLGDELLVRRAPLAGGGRPLSAVRIPRPARAALLLQAAAATAFFGARGFPLSPEDFEHAAWDGDGVAARFWLTRTPASVRASAAADVLSPEALRAVIRRLFAGESGRLSPEGARSLSAALEASDATWKRPEHWVASVLRAFPELAAAPAATARERCLGFAAEALRSPRARALTEKARAILRGRAPRLFEAGSSPLTPGGALRLLPPADGPADAARRLRSLARMTSRRAPSWIAVEPETWDPISRRAFDAARLSLARDGLLEVIVVPGALPAPDSPSEWRRAAWVPCGSLAGSVRFYEGLSAAASPHPHRARSLIRGVLGGRFWAAFAADPTGDGPIPPTLFEAVPSAAPPTRRGRDLASRDPGLRIERLLEEGQTEAALREAESWVAAFPNRPAVAWFSLAAHLAARLGASGVAAPAWLEAIEAEREIVGGRPAEAKGRLERVVRAPDADAGLRRRCRLRTAEIVVMQGQPGEAARRAAEWRRMHPEAPAAESVRALRLGASGFSREGRVDCALALLDEAERLGRDLPVEDVLETALARARVFALAGRLEDESAVYESVRPIALGAGDDGLAARFLSQEARGLLDRREHARAIVRFEEAMAASAADPGELAALALDLSAALYHSGRTAECGRALESALAVAASAGREDLLRIARGNRVELLVNRCAWDEAASEIAALARSARAERDDTRLLVALHHGSRLALRRGFLADAARENLEARRLADAVSDRLEIGELWLEEGDRRLYEGDAEAALAAWELAAAAPSDRCDRERLSRERLAEAAWRSTGGPPRAAWDELEGLFARDPYAASETVVRWTRLFSDAAVPARWRERAARCLRESGGAELAARVLGSPPAEVRSDSLRPLRAAVLAVLSGESPTLDGALGRLGLEGLAVRDSQGREVLAFGSLPLPEGAAWHPLEAGAARFSIALHPAPPREVLASVALLLETLLHRNNLYRNDGGGESTRSPPASRAHAWKRLGIVTGDASMEEPYARLDRFAPQDVTVVILGESGSGKEAVARAIHRLSRRSGGPFTAVNVAAIPGGVLESELFGHARGAFTGAEKDRRGLLEETAGGTIFFDEIGDLDLVLQVKLLRALQERELRRVGENRPRPIDVRVVSATSRDLARDVEAGRFREDLFYRLHVAVIRLPPLRERGRDTLLLARHFLERYARDYGKGALSLSPEAAAAIASHGWPGNVRELQNAMAQAAALCDTASFVTLEMLPECVRPVRAAASRPGGYRARVDAHRRDLIADALDRAGGNRSRAARELGLSRQALLYLIRELKVPVNRS
jgi:DNA-binding NtrC family response regulator